MINQLNMIDWNTSNKIDDYIREEGEGKLTTKDIADRLNKDRIRYVPEYNNNPNQVHRWNSDRVFHWIRKRRRDLKIGSQIKKMDY